MIHRFVFNRTGLILLLALGAGVLAAWAVQRHVQAHVELLESRARVPEVERIVAAIDLPAGARLDASHMAIRSFPAALAASDSYVPGRFTELEGLTLRSPLAAGDAILPVHVHAVRQNAFSTTLLNGRRAITMPVDVINSVSGLLQPGDLIDLYVSFEYQRRKITAPLLQGVLVLATGKATQQAVSDDFSRYDEGLSNYGTVTLDAAPEDVVKLVAARQSGIITAILRNPADDRPTTKASRGDLASLLGVNAPAPAPPSRRAPVLYGNTAIRSVPRLRTAGPRRSQPSGVFDLPYEPKLASSWRHQTAPSLSGAMEAPPGFMEEAIGSVRVDDYPDYQPGSEGRNGVADIDVSWAAGLSEVDGIDFEGEQ